MSVQAMTSETGTEARPVEVEALLETLERTPPNALSACPGRTAHTIGAHVAGAYEEIARHAEAFAAGSPLLTTRTFDEREAGYRMMTPAEQHPWIERNEERMRRSVAEVLELEPDPVMRWTGRQVKVRGFLKHMRSECVLHRWDIVGDDETSWQLLSRYELMAHAVAFLGPLPMTARGIAAGAGTGRTLHARIRAGDQKDLVIRVVRKQPMLHLVEQEGQALIEGDPAARLLMLWGRQATPHTRLFAASEHMDEVTRVQLLLGGY